jgi:hypothetical protein
MKHPKPKQGGKRKGAGRPAEYSEPTFIVGFRCPHSKIQEFTDHCNAKLKTWRVKK